MFDIDNAVQAEDTHTVHLKHPGTGVDTGITIDVYGMDSSAYRTINHAQRVKRLKTMKPGKSMPSPDELDKDAVDVLAACTAGWSNMVVKGETIPFNIANAAKLYTEYQWVREQVDEAIADRANFTKES